MTAPEPALKPNPHQGLRVLFIPLEFLRWQQGRSMTYASQLALEEGFHANGVGVVTLPALWDHPSSAPGSWLSRAKSLLAGQQFDQIWVTLVHSHFEEDFLEWLRTLAPVRIGFVVESLEYTAEECQAQPDLKGRRAYVEHQMRAMTHVLTMDEYDAERINAEGLAHTLWWPGVVPARVIAPFSGRSGKLPAVFYGAIYGERASWLQREDLRQLLVRPQAPEDATPLPQIFDKLQQATSQMLLSLAPVTRQTLETYLFAWRKLRRMIFDHWMAGLPNACAQVNLPSYLKAYSNRVIEAIAAGCPVISWDVPNRPRNRNLFREGEEILFFRRNQPAQLAAHIRRLQQEPEWARQLAARAQAKVAAFHSIEKRIRQVLDWVATGLQPEYGEITAPALPSLNPATTNHAPVATIDSDAHYINLFINNPGWSAPNPNADESARWARISALIEKIVAGQPAEKPWRILDVGCGRGWLTNLASKFGESEGVEPVAAVAAQARKLFPHLRFIAGNTDTVLDAPDFQSYDLVLASEVIEHVPREQQSEFVRKLRRLLKPGGHVILTTPRGESLQEWARLWGHPGQPVEDWLVEPMLRQLFVQENFDVAGHERVLFDTAKRQFVSSEEAKTANGLLAIYQVWAFQLPESQVAVAVSPIVRPEAVRAQFHRACHDALDRALQLLPDDPVLLTARASALLELGEPEAARQLLVWLVALEANYAPARRLLARALHQLGRAQEADAQISRAVQMEAVAAPVVSVTIPSYSQASCFSEVAQNGSQAKAFSFLHHVHEAELLDGSPAQLETHTATIDHRAAPCIYLHPAAKLRFAVPFPEPGRFTCEIAILPEAWNKPTADGCEFFIHLDGLEFFHTEINPRRLPTDRRWHQVEIEIPPAPGPSHEFIFRTKAVGSPPDFRWAVWCDPVFRPQQSPTAKLT